MKIDLGRYQDGDAANFVLSEHGGLVRHTEKLDDVDKTTERIDLVVPRGTERVSPAFLLALFGDSIRTLGSDGFKARLRIRAPRRLKIRESLCEVERVVAFMALPARERAAIAARAAVDGPIPSAKRVAKLAQVSERVAGDALAAARAERSTPPLAEVLSDLGEAEVGRQRVRSR